MMNIYNGSILLVALVASCRVVLSKTEESSVGPRQDHVRACHRVLPACSRMPRRATTPNSSHYSAAAASAAAASSSSSSRSASATSTGSTDDGGSQLAYLAAAAIRMDKSSREQDRCAKCAKSTKKGIKRVLICDGCDCEIHLECAGLLEVQHPTTYLGTVGEGTARTSKQPLKPSPPNTPTICLHPWLPFCHQMCAQ